MDTEQRLRQLEDDLKNSREMIAHLSGILQTMPKLGGRDEDLHRKLDTILQNQQNQTELEKKVEKLSEDVKNVAGEVRNSKEMLKVIDTVETSVGYAELFVKDFERIHSNILTMNDGFCNAIEETKQQTNNEVNKIGGLIRNLEANLQNLVAKEKSVADVVKKMEKFQQDLSEVKKALENKNSVNGNETRRIEKRSFLEVPARCTTSISDTVSLKDIRRYIEKIARPLADLTRNHVVNMKLLQEYIDTAANPNKNVENLKSQVFQEQIVMVPKLLSIPRTVCNAECCVEYIQVGKYQTKTVHEKICHDKCYTVSLLDGRKGEKDLKRCVVFQERNGWCSVCGCHWTKHSHDTYELQYETRMAEDVSARMKLNDYLNKEKMRESQMAQEKEKLQEMQQENEQIRDCCVEMVVFLEKNSMKKGCDPYYDHLRKLIEEEESKVELSHASFEMALELVDLQDSYKKRVEYIMKEINSGRRSALTIEQLNSLIDRLALMKYAGPTFSRLRDAQMSSDDLTQDNR